MRKSFRYKAKLSPSSVRRAEGQLALCAELYNAALQERRDAWRMRGVSLSATSQMAQLPDIKTLRPEFKEMGSQVLQDTIQRLDKAFQTFFRRVKSGETPGYPRFKKSSRYDSLTFKQSGWELAGKRLTLRGIGTLKLFLSRPVEGQIKTITLCRDRCGDWWVSFSCDQVSPKPLRTTGQDVGLDLGLEHFLATSEGTFVANPRPLRQAELALKRTQRRVSKRQKGSHRRRKLVKTLARKHRRVKNTRRDFHFKTAVGIVKKYDKIVVEDLNVRGLSRGLFSKSVHDAGWSQFIDILGAKAAEAARTVIKVNPSGTSQVCSNCGHKPDKKLDLSVRIYTCLGCGLTINRDTNAAINIKHIGTAQQKAGSPPSVRGRGGKLAPLT